MYVFMEKSGDTSNEQSTIYVVVLFCFFVEKLEKFLSRDSSYLQL